MTPDLAGLLVLAFIIAFTALVAACFAYGRGYKAGHTDGQRTARFLRDRPGQR